MVVHVNPKGQVKKKKSMLHVNVPSPVPKARNLRGSAFGTVGMPEGSGTINIMEAKICKNVHYCVGSHTHTDLH